MGQRLHLVWEASSRPKSSHRANSSTCGAIFLVSWRYVSTLPLLHGVKLKPIEANGVLCDPNLWGEALAPSLYGHSSKSPNATWPSSAASWPQIPAGWNRPTSSGGAQLGLEASKWNTTDGKSGMVVNCLCACWPSFIRAHFSASVG